MNWRERLPIIFLIVGTIGIIVAIQYNINYVTENNVNKEAVKSEIEIEDEEIIEEIVAEEKNEIKIQDRYFDEQKYLDSSIKVSDYIRSFGLSHSRTDVYKSSIAYELHVDKSEVNKIKFIDTLVELCEGIKGIWKDNGYTEDIYLVVVDENAPDVVLMLVENGKIILDNFK